MSFLFIKFELGLYLLQAFDHLEVVILLELMRQDLVYVIRWHGMDAKRKVLGRHMSRQADLFLLPFILCDLFGVQVLALIMSHSR
jgi:hypothetical protein